MVVMKASSGSDPRPSAPRPPASADVRKAVELMRNSLGDPLSMADLVRHCGISNRTLSKHFRAFLGLSPMQYLRRLRLTAARETLLSGRAELSVTDVARRCGFDHFGRFSEQYRRHFSELPSTTLRNSRRRASVPAQDSTTTRSVLSLLSRDEPSIAILPCQTLASEPADRWFADGIADALTTALGSVRSLKVVSPKSSHASHDPRRQARDLNARYVLTGRIVSEGAQLRVVLRISESASQQHVWGDSFDGERQQLLELQDRIVRTAIEAIAHRLRGAEIERARRALPENLDAYGLTMRALPLLFASRPDAARRALELLYRAIDFDPDYALATALAAWGHGQLVMYNGTASPDDDRSLALNLVRRAAILDDGDPIVLAARCAVHTMANEFGVAEALVARSLAIDPYSGWAWGRSAWLQAYKGDSETAIEQFMHSLALDPNPAARANSFTGIGASHFNKGRYDAAVFWLQGALLAEPTTAWPNRSLSVSYMRIGENLRARESIETLRRFCPDITVGQVVAAVPFRPQFLDRLGDGLSDLGLPL
jgi:TolB-like protein